MGLVRKFFICLSLITIPVLIESCENCGSEGLTSFYSITKLSLSTQTRGTVTTSPSPAPLNKYRFVIDIEGKISYLQSPFKMFRPTMAAYACSPVIPQSSETISELLITSDKPFSTTEDTIVPGGNLKDFFLVDLIDYPVTKIDDIIGKHFYDQRFNIISDKVMNEDQTHKLTIKITLDDGRTFEFSTNELVFTTK